MPLRWDSFFRCNTYLVAAKSVRYELYCAKNLCKSRLKNAKSNSLDGATLK